MKRKKYLWFALSGAACLLLLAVTIIGNLYGNGLFATVPPESETTSSTASSTSGEVQTQYVTGMVSEKNLEDLVRESGLIIRGTVESIDDSIQIMSVGGGVTNYTDYNVRVEEVVYGESVETVAVRIKGGIAGNLEVICDYAPTLEEGKEYLLFLQQPDRGGGYNTLGDYYYVTGSRQGAYEIEVPANTAGKTAETMTVKQQAGTMESTFAQLTNEIQSYRSELPENYVYSSKEEFMNNLQANLESGFISQEEYDELLAETEQYATIIG